MVSPLAMLNPRKPILIVLAIFGIVLLIVVSTSSLSSKSTTTSAGRFSPPPSQGQTESHQEVEIPKLETGPTSNEESNLEPAKVDAYVRTEYKDTVDEYTKIQFVNMKIPKSSDDNTNTVLLLSSIVNEKGYGAERSFKDFFNTLFEFDYPKNLISIAFLVGQDEEFKRIEAFVADYFHSIQLTTEHEKLLGFVSKITLISAPFIEKDFNVDRNNRHASSVQRLRRRQIARSRNFLLLNALENERYTMSLDSDIVEISTKEMLKVFVESGNDIIVPRVKKSWDNDYDRNSWRGERTVPNEKQMKMLDENDWENQDYVPRDVHHNMFHLYHALEYEDAESKKKDYHVPLDSVGGAVLFAKSIVYKQGVIFPTFYMIGTTWPRFEGYDGIETEGVCYMAKSLGYKCWAYINQLAIHNADS